MAAEGWIKYSTIQTIHNSTHKKTYSSRNVTQVTDRK